jgi:hypothetical protein
MRPRRIGKIKELVARLIAEGCQTRSQPLYDVAQPGEPAPLLDVFDRCRSERGQVAHDHVVWRGIGVEVTA